MKTTNHTPNFFLAAAPLLLIIFIDSMGLGLVFPILNALIIDPSSHFLSPLVSENSRNFIFGCIVSVFMLCWFFGAAFLGDLSDQIGRKRSLLLCLLGACIGYLISAVGVTIDSLTLLVTGRVIAGFTAGSQVIAQAAIIDISTPETKSRNIGSILFASSVGFILGPLIGGFFSNQHIVPWFNFAMPLYFSASISLANAALLWFLFRETFTAKNKTPIKLHRAIEIFISAFQNQKVRSLSIILLVMIFGWSSFYSFISMFLLKRYGFTTTNIDYFMALMAVGFGFGTGILVNYFNKCFSLKTTTLLGLIIAAFCFLVTAVTDKPIFAWLCVFPAGAAIALAYSTLLTTFSNQVDQDSQGWIMGITGSISAFAFGVNGFLVGIIANLSPVAPLVISTICLTVSFLLMKKSGGSTEMVNA
jgi:DHA1 family tetracycline resistance protein-like MFS transporter